MYTIDDSLPSFYHGILYHALEKPKIEKSFVFKCVSCKKGYLDSPIVSIAFELKDEEGRAKSPPR